MNRPTRWASRAVGGAVLAVPAGGLRDRYRQEFRAELYGMTRAIQFRHAAGLLAQAFALRSALATHASTNPDPVEDTVLATTSWWGRLLCLLNQHRYELFNSDDNEPYHRCVRCNRDLYIAPYPGGGAVSGPGVSFGP